MPTCKVCSKSFRDNYNLNRHLLKTKKCIKIEKEEFVQQKDTSGTNITIINNNTIHININFFINDNISHITPEDIIDDFRIINKITQNEYVRAGKLVTQFHVRVNKNECNRNIILPNPRSLITHVLTNNGWSLEPTYEIIDQTIKTRAGQLITYKDKIEECNERVFQVDANKRTWKHIEQFHKKGSEHKGTYLEDTRRVQSNIKVALLK